MHACCINYAIMLGHLASRAVGEATHRACDGAPPRLGSVPELKQSRVMTTQCRLACMSGLPLHDARCRFLERLVHMCKGAGSQCVMFTLIVQLPHIMADNCSNTAACMHPCLMCGRTCGMPLVQMVSLCFLIIKTPLCTPTPCTEAVPPCNVSVCSHFWPRAAETCVHTRCYHCCHITIVTTV